MFVPRRQEHEFQPQESALRTARTAATPLNDLNRGHSDRGQLLLTCLRKQRTPDLPDGTTQK